MILLFPSARHLDRERAPQDEQVHRGAEGLEKGRRAARLGLQRPPDIRDRNSERRFRFAKVVVRRRHRRQLYRISEAAVSM